MYLPFMFYVCSMKVLQSQAALDVPSNRYLEPCKQSAGFFC